MKTFSFNFYSLWPQLGKKPGFYSI